MPFLILLVALSGAFVSLLYYPDSPFYMFHNLKLEEIWLWAKYSSFLSALLVILSLLAFDKQAKGRDLARVFSAFVMVLQGILNLPPVFSYIVFLHGSAYAKLTASGNTVIISYKGLLLHVVVIAVSWSVAARLALDKKQAEPTESVNLPDAA